MSDRTGTLSCTLWCFVIGAMAGALATILLVLLGGFGWNGAVFTGAVLALALGLVLKIVLCRPLPTMAEVQGRMSAPAPAAAPVAARVVAPVAASAAAPAAAAPGGAVKPVFLSAARSAGPDDLKLIKGVGPKLEELLHSLGVFHFDQIAAWTSEEVAWVDDNLEGFKGRVSRDEWVAQARILAAGGSV